MDRPFAIMEVTPGGRLNDWPARSHLQQLDKRITEMEGEDGVNGLVIVAVRGEVGDVYERIVEALGPLR